MKNITLAEKLIMLSGAVLFALMIAVNSFCVNDNPGFRVPMTTYLIVMIALFFLDTIIFIFPRCCMPPTERVFHYSF